MQRVKGISFLQKFFTIRSCNNNLIFVVSIIPTIYIIKAPDLFSFGVKLDIILSWAVSRNWYYLIYQIIFCKHYKYRVSLSVEQRARVTLRQSNADYWAKTLFTACLESPKSNSQAFQLDNSKVWNYQINQILKHNEGGRGREQQANNWESMEVSCQFI